MKHIIPKLMGFRENSTKRDVYRDNHLHQMNSITLYIKELEKEQQPKPKGRKRNFYKPRKNKPEYGKNRKISVKGTLRFFEKINTIDKPLDN